MAFPTGWPPRPASGRRSIRYFQEGTTTGNFEDNAFLWAQEATANTISPMPIVAPGSSTVVNVGDRTAGGAPMGGGSSPITNPAATHLASADQPPTEPMIWCGTLRIFNDGANPIEFSFNGTDVHGKVLAGKSLVYRNRFEAGISLRFQGGTGASAFRIEAW